MIKNRGELIEATDQVNLTVQFKDPSGNPIDADSYPQISIIQPSGSVFMTPTSVGVSRSGVGLYSYIFTVPINASYGVWHDVWLAYINGFRVETQFEFIINYTQLAAPNTDGYVHLNDDPGFQYSQEAIININKLLKALKARLNSSGKAKSADPYGNVVYVDCDIFSTDMLVTFLATALWEFNQTPFFTFFEFDNNNFVEQFGQILVEFATIYALASKALIERGREFQFTDNGLNFTPPTVSELMMTQYNALLTLHKEKLIRIKESLRPSPQGLGVWGMTSSMNPLVRRLRFLRARQIF